ncbi:MAG: tRNA pseudouridine13 synthase [Thiomicrorhabdus sp.]|nr:MAG: tRNA pseudouridine13 synthase [Thiomicrorhabdus sp.]
MTTADQSNPADLTQLNYALGKPDITGVYKVVAEDFIVEEQIAYELSGEGEHLWCWVEKRGENTDWVLQQLAKWAGVSPSKVGIAGQKDRHAVTRQWFSIQLPGLINPQESDFKVANVAILKTIRHQRKLQTGGLSGNRFTLNIRNLSGGEDLIQVLQKRLTSIKTHGVPNYFGEQRFGIHGRNIKQGIKFLAGGLAKVKRNQKSMYLSAIRSWMFNELLSKRLALHNWNKLVKGDVLQLEGSNKWFLEDASTDLSSRVAQLDLHPTGALYGKGELPTEGSALAIEKEIAGLYQAWITGLECYGVNQDRRALRVLPVDFEWQWLASESGVSDTLSEAFNKIDRVEGWQDRPVLKLSFSLRSGSYATMVMRELLAGEDYQVILKDLSHPA